MTGRAEPGSGGPMGGRGVLVTRPASQAGELCRLIETAGGRPVLFPTVEIRPPTDARSARRLLGEPWDLMIFVSRNAVEQGLALAPDMARVNAAQRAAVGRATAAALTRAGLAPQLVPATGFDSEALLALPALRDAAGRRVLILRGEGGRPLLGDTLRERGAEVAYAEVYRRAAPAASAAGAVADWQRSLGYVTATSDEVLTNLLALVPESAHAWLKSLPLAVLSRRNAATAREMGFAAVAVAPETSDAGLCAALTELAAPPNPPI